MGMFVIAGGNSGIGIEAAREIFAGCESPGFARTSIFRDAPWFMKAFVALTAPFTANSVETGAHNAVEALLRGEGTSAFNWNKPGDFQQKFAISVDPAIQKAVIDASREVTGCNPAHASPESSVTRYCSRPFALAAIAVAG